MSTIGRRTGVLVRLHPGAVVVAVVRTPELRAAVAPSMAEWRRVPAHPVVVAERGSGISFWRGGRKPRRIFMVPWKRIAGIEVGERRAAYGVKVPVVELHLLEDAERPDGPDRPNRPDEPDRPDGPDVVDAVAAPAAVIPFAPAARGLSSPTLEQVSALAGTLRQLRPALDGESADPDTGEDAPWL